MDGAARRRRFAAKLGLMANHIPPVTSEIKNRTSAYGRTGNAAKSKKGGVAWAATRLEDGLCPCFPET